MEIVGGAGTVGVCRIARGEAGKGAVASCAG